VAETLKGDVAVVGGGPAGIAASCRAAESGASVVLLDEGIVPGGQIHRHRPGEEVPRGARPWIARLSRSGARVALEASVFDAERDGEGWLLRVLAGGRPLFVRARRLVLATGARELFLPFPGWTLPGVVGAGAAQALLKSGGVVAGRTAVVAGSGPLLLAAAAALAKGGADVALVAEQAERRALLVFAGALLGFPGKIFEGGRLRLASAGARYLSGHWVNAAGGEGRVERAQVTNGRRRLEVACDLLCVGYGLVPNLELPRLIGCDVEPNAAAVCVNHRQETSRSGVFAAGEICGIAGSEAAVAEGEIAGLASADALPADDPEAGRLFAARARARAFGRRLEAAFRLRPEVLRLAAPDTIVCRCEDVPLSRLEAAETMREAKLRTRAGMGPCQGRVCGAALAALRGFAPDSVRPPLVPVPLEALAAEEVST
jgi:NADPH-dependent 2,4-dienoyl-CoA reductase/sulfur reductase-like enzyme